MDTLSICPSCKNPLAQGARFCPSCGTKIEPVAIPATPHQPVAARGIPSAATVVKHPMSRTAKRAYALIAIGLVALFTYMFFEHLPGKPHPVIENQPSIAMVGMYGGAPIEQTEITARVENGKIIIPLPEVLDKKIVAFSYQGESTEIPLLAYINTDGTLVTGFRFCEPCNSTTYRIEGSELACGNCETKWKLNNLEGLQGSCQKYPPEPIPSEVVGTEIHLDESIVRNWKIRL